MNDRELIEEILDNTFTFGAEDFGYAAFFDNGGRGLAANAYLLLASKIIGEYNTDEDIHSTTIIADWFTKQQAKFVSESNNLLHSLDVGQPKKELLKAVTEHYANKNVCEKFINISVTNYFYDRYYRPKLENYLRDVIVRLGSFDWEFSKNGKLITETDILSLFIDEPDANVQMKIVNYYNTWCAIAKENYTRRSMKNY